MGSPLFRSSNHPFSQESKADEDRAAKEEEEEARGSRGKWRRRGGKGGIRERGIAIEKALRECKERAFTESDRKRDREGSGREGEKKREKEREKRERERKRARERWRVSVRRLFFVHANPMSGGVCARAHVRASVCVRVGQVYNSECG